MSVDLFMISLLCRVYRIDARDWVHLLPSGAACERGGMSEAEAALVFGGQRAPEPPSQAVMQLKGVAARRGEVQRPRDLAAARRVVEDLTRDQVLLEQLAAEALRWSGR